MTDPGIYNADTERYASLVNEMYRKYAGGVTLPPEYASFVENDLLRLLIRLARYKFVARMLGKGDRVLEVGSGSGLGCIFLAQHCREVVGLDVKTTEVEEARKLNPRENVSFVCKDLFAVGANHEFDVAVALDVIEHMPIEQGSQLLAAMSGQIKAEGMVIIGSPSLHSYPYQSALSQASHVKCYEGPELRELMERHFHRVLPFSMNDELVHTGHHKMAWYYMMIGLAPKAPR
jgi:2-polyprenyl-3-methyl-5-hydroxy-6-metoxy-1,4-benzoquinol methylase